MKHLTMLVVIAAVVCGASRARAQSTDASSRQVADPEQPPVVVTASSVDDASTLGSRRTTLSLTLYDGLPGVEYSRRVAPHLELTFGLNSLGAVAWTPSAGMRVRAFEHRRWSPYVYGRVAQVFNPGFMDLQLAAGGAGFQWLHGEHGVVFAQLGAAASRDVDREDGNDYAGAWGVVPDVLVGYGVRF